MNSPKAPSSQAMAPGPSPLSRFVASGQEISAEGGTCLFEPGVEAQAFYIVTQGCVRVEQTNTQGRTVVLYRVRAGDSCVMTTSCMLSGKPYAGYGYAEGHTCVVAIPGQRFQALLDEQAEFRAAVFGSFAARIGELTGVIDELLLHRTDLRLAKWLSGQGNEVVHLTHQEIAQEIGTAREVVSRTLKAFERQGLLRLARNKIEIVNAAELRRQASENS